MGSANSLNHKQYQALYERKTAELGREPKHRLQGYDGTFAIHWLDDWQKPFRCSIATALKNKDYIKYLNGCAFSNTSRGGNSTMKQLPAQPTQQQPTQHQPTQHQPTQHQPMRSQPLQMVPLNSAHAQMGAPLGQSPRRRKPSSPPQLWSVGSYLYAQVRKSLDGTSPTSMGLGGRTKGGSSVDGSRSAKRKSVDRFSPGKSAVTIDTDEEEGEGEDNDEDEVKVAEEKAAAIIKEAKEKALRSRVSAMRPAFARWGAHVKTIVTMSLKTRALQRSLLNGPAMKRWVKSTGKELALQDKTVRIGAGIKPSFAFWSKMVRDEAEQARRMKTFFDRKPSRRTIWWAGVGQRVLALPRAAVNVEPMNATDTSSSEESSASKAADEGEEATSGCSGESPVGMPDVAVESSARHVNGPMPRRRGSVDGKLNNAASAAMRKLSGEGQCRASHDPAAAPARLLVLAEDGNYRASMDEITRSAEALGAGDFGSVSKVGFCVTWKFRRVDFGHVALKEASVETRGDDNTNTMETCNNLKALENEFHILAHLQSVDGFTPHVVELLATTGSSEGRLSGLLLGLYSCSLREHIEMGSSLSLRIEQVADCARGIAHLIKMGVIHRDIKDGNILVDGESGRAVIADFGCAMFWVQGQSLPSGLRGAMQTGNAFANNCNFVKLHFHRNFDLIGLSGVIVEVCLDAEGYEAYAATNSVSIELALQKLDELMPADHPERQARTQLLHLGDMMPQYVGAHAPLDEASQASADVQDILAKLAEIRADVDARAHARAPQWFPELDDWD